MLRRRADGYHDLVTVMQMVSLADELTVTPEGDDVRFSCDQPDLPQGRENLVCRAALGFQEETGVKVAAHLSLHKRIPAAAGLGGGTSDAAGALKALNLLMALPWTARGCTPWRPGWEPTCRFSWDRGRQWPRHRHGTQPRGLAALPLFAAQSRRAPFHPLGL